MNKYELALVINGKVDEEVRTSTVEKAKELIAQFGGTLNNVDDWGKRRLAYEINKIKEGFYYIINFEANANVPAEIESRLRIMEPVLRFLVTKDEA